MSKWRYRSITGSSTHRQNLALALLLRRSMAWSNVFMRYGANRVPKRVKLGHEVDLIRQARKALAPQPPVLTGIPNVERFAQRCQVTWA